MKDVVFKISKKTQARVRELGKRYVHAFAHGKIVEKLPSPMYWLKATYNPYDYDGFTLLVNKAMGVRKETLIKEAKYVKFDEEGMWIGLIGVTRKASNPRNA
jgi:hypothetical protein